MIGEVPNWTETRMKGGYNSRELTSNKNWKGRKFVKNSQRISDDVFKLKVLVIFAKLAVVQNGSK